MIELFGLFEKSKLISVYKDRDAAIAEKARLAAELKNPYHSTCDYEVCKLPSAHEKETHHLTASYM